MVFHLFNKFLIKFKKHLLYFFILISLFFSLNVTHCFENTDLKDLNPENVELTDISTEKNTDPKNLNTENKENKNNNIKTYIFFGLVGITIITLIVFGIYYSYNPNLENLNLKPNVMNGVDNIDHFIDSSGNHTIHFMDDGKRCHIYFLKENFEKFYVQIDWSVWSRVGKESYSNKEIYTKTFNEI